MLVAKPVDATFSRVPDDAGLPLAWLLFNYDSQLVEDRLCSELTPCLVYRVVYGDKAFLLGVRDQRDEVGGVLVR